MSITARLATDEDSWKKRQMFLLKKMNTYRRKGTFIDVTLRCGNCNFQAQKLALAARSQFFANMFLSGCFPDIRNINLDVSEAAMGQLLQYVYTDKMPIPSQVTAETLKQILNAADLLKIDGAIQHVTNKLFHRKHDDLIMVLWDWADNSDNEELIHQITEYIYDNIKTLKKSHTILSLSVAHLQTLLDQASKYPDAYNDILKMVILWVKVDEDKRKEAMRYLLPRIPLQNVSSDYLLHLKSKEPILSTILNTLFTESSDEEMAKCAFSVICRKKKKFIRAQRSPTLQEPMYTKTGLIFQDKPAEDNSGTFLADSRSSPSQRSQGSSPKSDSTEEMSHVTFRKAVTMSGLALIAVGVNGYKKTLLCLYIAAMGCWTTPITLEVPYREKTMIIHDNSKLYVFGGETENGTKVADTGIFYPSACVLHDGPAMKFARCSAGVTSFRNKVYVIGGMTSSDQVITCVEVLNTKTDTWQDAKPTNEKHVNPAVAVTSAGLVYVVGGLTTCCEYYNPIDDCWTNICHLPDLCRKVAMFGGYAEKSVYAVSYFNPVSICCIKTPNNELQVMSTTGHPPEQVVNLITIGQDLWVLDAKGRFYCCDLNANRWDKTTVCCPKAVVKPIYSTLLSLKQL